jgi:hypothetical protein
MENSNAVRLARVVGGAAVLAGLAASITSCSGNGSNAPSTTQSPTTTTTTTQSPTPAAPPPAPTEKSINPTGGNLFTPTVHAPTGADGHPRKQRKYRIGHRERAEIDGWLITTTGAPMTIVNKGFRGRRAESARQLPPGQHLTADFPVLQAGPTPRIDLELAVHHPRRAWRRTRMDLGPAEAIAQRAAHCRHSLRHHVVQAGYQVGRRFAGHAFRISRHHRRIRTGRFLRRLHHQHPGGRSSRRQGLDRLRLPGRTA